MSAAKRTPGPWTAYPDGTIRAECSAQPLPYTIAVVIGDADVGPNVAAANARLIAAAPETAEKAMAFTLLVERFLRDDLDDGIAQPTEGELVSAMYALRAHIAKATGSAA